MESTNFQQDHHQPHYHHHQQQQQQQPPYPYIGYSSLLDEQRHHSYRVSPSPHHQILRQQKNQGGGEVPSASSGVTSDASSFSYHSISSNSDDIASPNFPSNFLGMIQSPNDRNLANAWLPPGSCSNTPRSYINNSFTSLLTSSNVLGQLGLTSCLSPSPASSCFLGLNLQDSDFLSGSSLGYGDALAAGKEAGGLSWPSRSRALESIGCSSYGLSKVSPVVNNGVAGTKRPAGGNYADTSSKASSLAISNKKSSSKTYCPPFKVRTEKLGDRIAALHQLVSPFGKTDTASVLTEAIGYIQFLQDQIHTLCMPNVKPLRNKPCSRIMQTVSSEDQQESKEPGAAQDLRKRGLCLVPLSWTSFITADQLDAFINNPHHYF